MWGEPRITTRSLKCWGTSASATISSERRSTGLGEFCTGKKWLGIDPKRLSVTVYFDDDEAADIWHEEIGVAANRIERMGEHDNFWPADAPSEGPDGLCGPCSEIFYDDDFGETVEIWNLVFTQFNRVGDPPDNLRPLPSKNIDTGMGLERTAAVLQGVETNYHIDILRPIVEAAAEICGRSYVPTDEFGRRLRRITDHLRASVFAIHENIYPGAQKEKYVVRRLLRRAVLDGHCLGLQEPSLYQLVPVVAEIMNSAYPELAETKERVAQVIQKEEQTFFATIDAGLARVERVFDDMSKEGRMVVAGEEAAELYSTYGLPPELVESLAAERNLTFDKEGFQRAMRQHGIDSGKAQFELFKTGPIEALKAAVHRTEFQGYSTEESDAEIRGVIAQDRLCDELTEIGHDQPVTVVLSRTSFYAESGGQVGDTGRIEGDGFSFEVKDTVADGELILHSGHLKSGKLRTGVPVKARVDSRRRAGIRRAHSATHILHYALRRRLGQHAQQQGSKVDDDWLRFDFTNMSPVTDEQLVEIEQDVIARIAEAAKVSWDVVPLSQARESGAMMLFGEKYPDPVRLVAMGDFSRELCGGTHVDNTQRIGAFEILSEEGVSAGTRRIVAVTGEKARLHAEQVEATIREVAQLLNVAVADVPGTVRALSERQRALKRQLSQGGKAAQPEKDGQKTASAFTDTYAERRAALYQAARVLNVSSSDLPERLRAVLKDVQDAEQQLSQLQKCGVIDADSLLEQAADVNGIKVIIAEAAGANPNLMRQLIDQLRKKLDAAAVMLVTAQGEDKVLLVAGLSKQLVQQGLHAGNWVKHVAAVVGGGGGGRPDMAQAGGKQPDKLPEALERARDLIVEQINEARK
jgi:alanyl-tRNA synthetase